MISTVCYLAQARIPGVAAPIRLDPLYGQVVRTACLLQMMLALDLGQEQSTAKWVLRFGVRGQLVTGLNLPARCPFVL